MDHKVGNTVVPQTEDVSTLTTTTTLSSSTVTDGGYDYELIEGTDARYECPICLLYLRDPVLTTCGHRFCSGCISQWVIKEGGRCPVDGVSLSHENIFPDNYTRREILQCKAKCPYVKNGCNTVLSLSDLERHIHSHHMSLNDGEGSSEGTGKSPGNAVPCLYKEVGCVSYFPVEQLQRHLEIDVHHHLQLLTAAYKRLKLFPSKTSVDSHHPMDMLSRQDSRESTHWLLAEDGNEPDDYQFRRQRSWDSVRYARKYHIRSKYPERLAESDESVCKSDHHRKGKCDNISPSTSVAASATTLTTYVPSETELNIKDIFERLVCLEQNDREKQIKIESLESKLTKAMDLFSTVTTLMDDLTTRYCNGIFVWKIPNFRQTCIEMRKNPNRVVNSPGFYTDTFGYKLGLRFNLTTPSSSTRRSSDDQGSSNIPLEEDVDTFLSLYVHFMMGEFDDTLRWPFHGEMRLVVIHPSRPQHSLLEIMHSKPEAGAFAKPTLPRNPTGFGYPDICSISKIFSTGFVKKDTLVCKVLVKSRATS